MTVRSLCAIAAGVLALAFAGSVQAAPTGACLWSGMTAAERAALSQIVRTRSGMNPAVGTAITRTMRRCGFEAGPSGLRRAGFLAAMMATRSATESQMRAFGPTPAQLNRAYVSMDPVLKRQITAVAEARYAGRQPTAPDRQRFAAVLAQLRLQGPQAAAAMQNYVLLRATIEFVERLGPRFAPPPAAGGAAR